MVKAPEAKRGSALLPRPRVVEGSFAWAARCRRFVRNDERWASRSAGPHRGVFVCLMLEQAEKLMPSASRTLVFGTRQCFTAKRQACEMRYVRSVRIGQAETNLRRTGCTLPSVPTESLTMSNEAVAIPSTVLVVEDESMVRLVAVDMLEEAGFPVLQAATADAAWAILERGEDIGILFTDVDMPGTMDGLALATRVAERWPHIHLVVTSGRVRIRDADMPDDGRFLIKPYRQAQLLKAIDAMA